jgi:hypothetical protein
MIKQILIKAYRGGFTRNRRLTDFADLAPMKVFIQMTSHGHDTGRHFRAERARDAFFQCRHFGFGLQLIKSIEMNFIPAMLPPPRCQQQTSKVNRLLLRTRPRA